MRACHQVSSQVTFAGRDINKQGGDTISTVALGTKHTVSAPMRAGIDNLKRLGLKTEFRPHSPAKELIPFAEFAISGHAPYTKGDMRLNYAATDDEFREMSINEMMSYIDMVRRFPSARQINMHFAPKQWLEETQTGGRFGDYNLMIDSIRKFADYSARWGIEIVLENNNAYFVDVPDDASADGIDWSKQNSSFGASPEEWIQICEDVSRPNAFLCLDSSHTCTYAHTFADPDRRKEVVLAFLSRPELIKHVHWNDNYLYEARGRNDSHALLDKGTLPLEMHKIIKGLDATILLEHFYSIEELEDELEFIASL